MPLTVAFPEERARAYRAAGWWRGDTLSAWVGHWAATTPHKPAIVGRDTTLTYAELWRAARALAGGLRRLGVTRGDVLAVQLPNSAEFLIAYVAAGLCGAVLQPVHMNYRASELETLLGHSSAKAVIALSSAKDYPAAEVLRAVRARLARLEHIILVGAAAQETHQLRDLMAAGETTEGGTPARVRAEDPFLLLYTSGTTEAPKGVPAVYESYLSNARISASELGITAHSIVLSAAPFTHLYGLFSANMAFATGATIALLPAFTPPDFVAALAAFKPTGIFTAPAHFAACFQHKLMTSGHLSSLAFAQISGSACAPDLASALQDLMPGGKVVQLWGMTELQAGAFHRLDDPLDARVGSVGRASPGAELRIAGADNAPLDPGEEGELQVRGGAVFCGYHANAPATAAAFTADGWFRTGDLATIDARGYVRITGRIKELINRGGVKFNPLDIEALIDRHPAVAQSAVVPMPDPLLGERACCFVVPRAGQDFTFAAMQAWLAQHGVSKMKWPERLETIDAMPLTPTRKIMKGKLVERLAALASYASVQSNP